MEDTCGRFFYSTCQTTSYCVAKGAEWAPHFSKCAQTSGLLTPNFLPPVLQAVDLVADLLAELPESERAAFTVVCADLDTADLASQRLPNPVAVVDPADSGVTKGPLLIVNSRNDQVLDAPSHLCANKPVLCLSDTCRSASRKVCEG